MAEEKIVVGKRRWQQAIWRAAVAAVANRIGTGTCQISRKKWRCSNPAKLVWMFHPGGGFHPIIIMSTVLSPCQGLNRAAINSDGAFKKA